ncbi:type IV toxin-antitoxin system YeeU family antitoxin [Aeromonas salmonicida]|uniref:type IV toxin-antitoxin system YeeU family antitoxin n=1 Tax=Aeromonas salmonicida TaxID=645 RepID=UPI001E490C69|nr:type IV toxin-antitoxin system YeeU family antitoxin [Aeromonas salmonicida]WGI41272.1 type IV toxin-antitoxin system YeeU family antitoxin [Aeromonas salmonicida]
MNGFDDLQHPWPWEQSVHASQEYLFASFAAFTIELAIREGELVTHAEPHPWCQVGLMISHQGLVRTFPKLEAVFPEIVKELEGGLLSGELDPRCQKAIRIEQGGFICEADTLGSFGYVYINISSQY